MFGRGGRPGLLRLAAGTAVVAGTATAVSGGVRRRQDARAQESAEAQAYEAQQQQAQMNEAAAAAVAAQQSQVAPAQQSQVAPAPAPAADTGDVYEKISQLAGLHTQGLLTDEEFSAAKGQLLGL